MTLVPRFHGNDRGNVGVQYFEPLQHGNDKGKNGNAKKILFFFIKIVIFFKKTLFIYKEFVKLEKV